MSIEQLQNGAGTRGISISGGRFALPQGLLSTVSALLAGLCLLMLPMAMPGGADLQAADSTSLVRLHDSPHIYFVDRFGIRHRVASPDVLKAYFGYANAKEITFAQLLALPRGEEVNAYNSPEVFDAQPDPYARYVAPPQPVVVVERVVVRDEGRRHRPHHRSRRSHHRWRGW